MEELAKLLDAIVEGKDGYRLVVIPILRDTDEERDYVTLPEVKDKVTIEDTGSIDKLKVKADVDKPIFVRAGSIFEGKGTQSRAVESNVIVIAESTLPVKCVHQSHPIVAKASFDYCGVAPKPVLSSLVTGDQTSVWSSVRFYALSASSAPHLSSTAHRVVSSTVSVTDSLVDIKRAIRSLDSKMKEVLEKVPAFENQVGAVIVSVNGIEGVEVFDHPESWRAHYKEVLENYDCIAEQAPPFFKVDVDAVKEYVVDFLKKLKNSKARSVNDHTWLIRMDDYIGEFTVLNGRIIHLFLVKREEVKSATVSVTTSGIHTREDYFIGPSNEFNYWRTLYSVNTTSWSTFVDDVRSVVERRKGMKSVLHSLSSGEKTWSELVSSVGVSKATLSSRLKNGMSMGLIDVEYRDGRKVYKLTDKGKEFVNRWQ